MTDGPAQGAKLELHGVRFAFPRGASMAFDLMVAPGEIVALMGASGSGKSTLLNLVAGFETPAAGIIAIDGADVTGLPPAARPVSMVFQENNLFAHLDVFANVGLGRSPSLRLSRDDRDDIESALAETGLADKAKRLPGALSGGERQRVALARVLVRRKPLLLLDEAFAALGPALRADMLDLVATLNRQTGMSVVMATHMPDDARRIAGRIAFVEDGRIAAAGPVDDFFGPDAPAAFRRYAGETNA